MPRAPTCAPPLTRARRPTARGGSRATESRSTGFRSRCVRRTARLRRADDDLHPHLPRMVLAQDVPGPDLAELVAVLAIGLELRGEGDALLARLLDRDVVDVGPLPPPEHLVALGDLDPVGLEEVVLDLHLARRGIGERDDEGESGD